MAQGRRVLTTVVSSDGSAPLTWQTQLLAHSHHRVGQSGPLVVLTDTVTVGDDVYPPYNKPYALWRWCERDGPATEWVLVLDPDMVFRAPCAGAPEPGRPVAHDSTYRAGRRLGAALARHIAAPGRLQSLMVPLVMHRADLAQLAPLWFEWTCRLRADPAVRAVVPWICEMWGASIAAYELGLTFELRDLAAHPPFSNSTRLPFVHYSYEVDGFDKRHYRPWEPMPEGTNAAYRWVRELAEDYVRRQPPAFPGGVTPGPLAPG
jgi:hypothetical protein